MLVLNFNGLEHLEECFDSIAGLDYPKNRFETIMVDNGSADESVAFVRKRFPWVRIVKLDRNYGFAEGNNLGVHAAKGEYVVFLNNDTKVARGWLSGLVDAACTSESVGICGSKLFDQKMNKFIGEGRLSIFGVPDITSRHSKTSECFFVSGASMLVKRKVIRHLGQCFDPEFFAYFEDVDLCWRAKLAGYKVVYAPASELVHRGGATSKPKSGKPRGGSSLMKFYHYRNKIWAFRKNTRFPLTQLLIVPLLATTLLQVARMATEGDWKYGISVLGYAFSDKKKSAGIYKVTLERQLQVLLE